MTLLKIILPFAICGSLSATSRIAGTVTGADGSVITSGVVTATMISAASAMRVPLLLAGPRLARLSGSASFAFDSLPDGVYRFCASETRSWLDSCDWGGLGLTVSVPSAASKLGLSIVVARAAIIEVTISDPSQKLLARSAGGVAAHVTIGVLHDGRFFEQARLSASDATSRTYNIAIPFDRTLFLHVTSALLQLKDSSGAALPRVGAKLSISVPFSRSTVSPLGIPHLKIPLTTA